MTSVNATASGKLAERPASATAAKLGTMARDSVKTVIAASMVGTAIEFYDFYAYGTAAANYFPKMFFSQKPTPPWVCS
jgi:hypothetical protein